MDPDYDSKAAGVAEDYDDVRWAFSPEGCCEGADETERGLYADMIRTQVLSDFPRVIPIEGLPPPDTEGDGGWVKRQGSVACLREEVA